MSILRHANAFWAETKRNTVAVAAAVVVHSQSHFWVKNPSARSIRTILWIFHCCLFTKKTVPMQWLSAVCLCECFVGAISILGKQRIQCIGAFPLWMSVCGDGNMVC